MKGTCMGFIATHFVRPPLRTGTKLEIESWDTSLMFPRIVYRRHRRWSGAVRKLPAALSIRAAEAVAS